MTDNQLTYTLVKNQMVLKTREFEAKSREIDSLTKDLEQARLERADLHAERDVWIDLFDEIEARNP